MICKSNNQRNYFKILHFVEKIELLLRLQITRIVADSRHGQSTLTSLQKQGIKPLV